MSFSGSWCCDNSAIRRSCGDGSVNICSSSGGSGGDANKCHKLGCGEAGMLCDSCLALRMHEVAKSVPNNNQGPKKCKGVQLNPRVKGCPF